MQKYNYNRHEPACFVYGRIVQDSEHTPLLQSAEVLHKAAQPGTHPTPGSLAFLQSNFYYLCFCTHHVFPFPSFFLPSSCLICPFLSLQIYETTIKKLQSKDRTSHCGCIPHLGYILRCFLLGKVLTGLG